MKKERWNDICVKGVWFSYKEENNQLFVTDNEHEIICYDLDKYTYKKALGKGIAYLMYWYL